MTRMKRTVQGTLLRKTLAQMNVSLSLKLIFTARSDPNKEELENIVVSMVETSSRVKNQLHYCDGTKDVGEVMRHGRGIYYDQDGSIYDGEWYED
jgi:hypothetical protein